LSAFSDEQIGKALAYLVGLQNVCLQIDMVPCACDCCEHRAVRRGAIDQDTPVVAPNKRRIKCVLDLGQVAREQIGRAFAFEAADKRSSLDRRQASRRADYADA
jgi:hypothetical protein